jgi:RimJ/RimL family protein N-acetyltransferase
MATRSRSWRPRLDRTLSGPAGRTAPFSHRHFPIGGSAIAGRWLTKHTGPNRTWPPIAGWATPFGTSGTCRTSFWSCVRPVEGADLPQLLRMRWDAEATGEFQWFGYRIDDARRVERRWHEDGLIVSDAQSFLTVASDDDCAGWVGWRPTTFGNFEIGAALFPPFSGRGIGTEAQRLLVDYLFTTTAHRLQAGTEVDNMAEQRALERLGFTREGIQRGAGFRAGAWRDGVTYSILRNE